jgi:4-alpha-glucanotransferase
MKVTIRLRYYTRFGQELFLRGDHEWFGGGQPPRALPLRYVNEAFWELALDLPDTGLPTTPVSYYFLVRQPDGSELEDFGGGRCLDLAGLPRGGAVILDSWNDVGAVDNIFCTDAFKNVLLRMEDEPLGAEPPAAPILSETREQDTDKVTPVGRRSSGASLGEGSAGASPCQNSLKTGAAGATHGFNVKAPVLAKGQTMCLLGGSLALGGWNQDAPVLLRRDRETGDFRVQLDLAAEPFPVAYKYGVYDTARNVFVRYEDGANRVLAQAAIPDGIVIVNDGFARLPRTPWRGAGVAIPVFSLRGERSFGVGEFLDLRPLADWARRAGLELIQILPVNDTSATHSWMDSYPYAAISAFALHPLYLNLDRVAGSEHRPLLESLEGRRQELNALEKVDYEGAMKAKLEFVRRIFPALREKTLAGAEYRDFFARNESWLAPYAAFCFLRDKFGTADFNQWPDYRVYDAARISALAAGDAAAREEMDLHGFMQFHLHLQLREAADHAHGQGVILKGDVAIGVHPHSAEVWQRPELFHTAMQAGAPPDAFSAKGQNWGFPTYNWPRMKQDGFAWWKSRLAHMSCYFDAIRIDHVLGFFRIWSIPRDAVEGILGYFVPAVPVEAGELTARGVPFDRERLARPFINEAVLREIFGDGDASEPGAFLNPVSHGAYALKPEFATQRNVEKHFAPLKNDPRAARLKERLFDLIGNVVLIEVQGGAGVEYHFRLGMEQTASFRQLDPRTQASLQDLCADYFFRRQEEGWRREGWQKLLALKRATNMLICGEDLGMVPACVPGVMKGLGLLGLEVQRMSKKWGVAFTRPADAPYLSVATPGTHDMTTLRGWWLENKEFTQQFFNEELHFSGQAPPECEPRIVQEIVRQHLDAPAMWSIFPLQDLLAMDGALRRPEVEAERINVPAESDYCWDYRMHLSLEALGKAEDFSRLLERLVQESGR